MCADAPNGNQSELNALNLPNRVRTWLDSTGYPLEMRVAQRFRGVTPEPTLIGQGGNYQDRETGKIRETDVEVLWINISPNTMQSIALQVLVECKTGGQPWVMFADPDDSFISVAHYGLAVAASAEPSDKKFVAEVHEELIELGIPLFEGPTPFCYSIVQMKKDGDVKNERNEAYDSVRQAASGAAAAVANLRPDTNPPSLTYVVPVVVTTHPLLVANLTPEGEIEVHESDWGSMPVRPAGHDDSILVHVVRESALGKFVAICTATAKSFESVHLKANRMRRFFRKLGEAAEIIAPTLLQLR